MILMIFAAVVTVLIPFSLVEIALMRRQDRAIGKPTALSERNPKTRPHCECEPGLSLFPQHRPTHLAGRESARKDDGVPGLEFRVWA